MNEFESALQTLLEKKLQSAPDNLAKSIRYSVLSGGKRIRPRLLLETAGVLGLSPQSTLPAALAVELIHCFTLIHDDLPCMDDDDFRRGKPSNHKVYGEAVALLAGDAIIPLAFESFLELGSNFPPEKLLAALQEFLKALGPEGVIAGQAREIELSLQKATLEDCLRMQSLKTGALFKAAVTIPLQLSGLDLISEKAQSLIFYSKAFGNAFQVADDYEDRSEDGNVNASAFHYASEKQTTLRAVALLDEAHHALRSAWNEKAEGLLKFSAKLVERLSF